MEWVKVDGIDVWHRHRPAKVLPMVAEGVNLSLIPPVLEASALPPVQLELNIADFGTGYGGYLVAHCPQCDLMFYNPSWWDQGRDNPRVASGLKKRFPGAQMPS